MASPTSHVAGIWLAHGKRRRDTSTPEWAGSTLQITSGDAFTWAHDSRFSGVDHTGWDVVADIVDYFTGVTFATPRTFSWQVSDEDPGLGATLTASGSVAWVASAGLQALLNWAASGTATTITSSAAASGTVKGAFNVANMTQWNRSPAFVGQAGSAQTAPGVYGHRRPTLRTVYDEQHTARLGEELRAASSPRKARVYRTQDADWVALSVGQFTADRAGILYNIDAAVLG
jgi:hypothetical protein